MAILVKILNLNNFEKLSLLRKTYRSLFAKSFQHISDIIGGDRRDSIPSGIQSWNGEFSKFNIKNTDLENCLLNRTEIK